MICCFSDFSQTYFRRLQEIKIKIKGQTGKEVHENAKFVEKYLILKNYFLFPGFFQTFLKNNQWTGGPEKQ